MTVRVLGVTGPSVTVGAAAPEAPPATLTPPDDPSGEAAPAPPATLARRGDGEDLVLTLSFATRAEDESYSFGLLEFYDRWNMHGTGGRTANPDFLPGYGAFWMGASAPFNDFVCIRIYPYWPVPEDNNYRSGSAFDGAKHCDVSVDIRSAPWIRTRVGVCNQDFTERIYMEYGPSGDDSVDRVWTRIWSGAGGGFQPCFPFIAFEMDPHEGSYNGSLWWGNLVAHGTPYSPGGPQPPQPDSAPASTIDAGVRTPGVFRLA